MGNSAIALMEQYEMSIQDCIDCIEAERIQRKYEEERYLEEWLMWQEERELAINYLIH